VAVSSRAVAVEDSTVYRGRAVPAEVEKMYDRGLRYLSGAALTGKGIAASVQRNGPALAGFAMLAMLAHGDEPNVGPHAKAIRASLEIILKGQNEKNGYIGTSMYNHGFATLALAEAYGAVSDERIGPALQKAVELILSAQRRNPSRAWRYRPDSTDADTTVSGACMVALLAARNAGFAIPDRSIKDALRFYSICQSSNGSFGYVPGTADRSGGAGPTTAIGVALYAYARQKNTSQFARGFAVLWQSVRAGRTDTSSMGRKSYMLYYLSQALFQADVRRWQIWNRRNTRELRETQQADGSWVADNYGPFFSTSAALLSLALNYRYLPIYER
jgi:hypothetical protein